MKLSFNKPPLLIRLILKEKIIPEIAKQLATFSRNLKTNSTKSSMLKYQNLAGRLGITEKKVEEKAHIPVNFFK